VGSSWNYYGVKLVYQLIVTSEPIRERVDEKYNDTHTFFEESIILVRAQSSNHAYKIAEQKVSRHQEPYINPYGQKVECKLIEAIDCFLIDDPIKNGTELYSVITPVIKEMTPAEYLMRRYEYSLGNYEWNQERREEIIDLMTILRYEDFSMWRKE